MNTINVINNKEIVRNQNKKEPLSLQDLLMPGSAEPGFYVASGTRELVPFVLDRLVGFLKHEGEIKSSDVVAPPKPRVLVGSWQAQERLAPVLLEKSLLASGQRASGQIGQLFWVDSGNSFDPYRVALTSVKRGLSPVRILRAIQVARPFTAFQFQQMLDKVPHPTLLRMQEKGQSTQVVWRRPLVIISDIMKLFYDEEIQEKDVMRAFRDFLIRLSFLKNRAIILGLHVMAPAPTQRALFLDQVLALATRVRMFSSGPVPVGLSTAADKPAAAGGKPLHVLDHQSPHLFEVAPKQKSA